MPDLTNPKAIDYWKRVADHLQRLSEKERKELPALHNEFAMPEIDAWYWYFSHHLGWIPAALQSFMDGSSKAFTVPAQWPEWFDLSYAPPANIPAAPKRRTRELDASEKQTYAELMARVRRIWETNMSERELRGEDYQSMFRKHGRPIGRFEKQMPERPKPDNSRAGGKEAA